MEEKRQINGNKLIEVAKRNLAEMKTMFENRHYYGTVNRTYHGHLFSEKFSEKR